MQCLDEKKKKYKSRRSESKLPLPFSITKYTAALISISRYGKMKYSAVKRALLLLVLCIHPRADSIKKM